MSIVSTFTAELGNFTLTIYDGGGSSTSFATKIGNIKYDFDIVGDENNVTSKIVSYNVFEFELHKYDTFGNNLYDRLYSNLSSAIATVTLEVDLFSTAENWQFTFKLQQSGLIYEEKTGKLKCKCTTYFNSSLTVADVFGIVTNFVVKTSGVDKIGISVGTFIEFVISQLNTSLSTNVLELAPCATTNFVDEFYKKFNVLLSDLNPNDKALFLANNSASFLDISAFDLLANLAILEGGIFGTGFNSNFYINRSNIDSYVTIAENNVINRSFKPRNPAFGKVSILNNVSGNLVLSSQSSVSSPVISKSFVFGVIAKSLFKGENILDGGVMKMWQNYAGSGSIDIEDDLLNSGLDNLKLSYPITNTNIIVCEIRDCSKIPVFKALNFEGSPSVFYRISNAEYDLYKNSVKITAYEV